MILCLNNTINSIAGVGLLIQTGKFVPAFQNGKTAVFCVLMMVFIVFYIGAITISFYAYREFKGMMQDNGMGGNGGLQNLMPMGRQSSR